MPTDLSGWQVRLVRHCRQAHWLVRGQTICSSDGTQVCFAFYCFNSVRTWTTTVLCQYYFVLLAHLYYYRPFYSCKSIFFFCTSLNFSLALTLTCILVTSHSCSIVSLLHCIPVASYSHCILFHFHISRVHISLYSWLCN